jgi:hypothetical protein
MHARLKMQRSSDGTPLPPRCRPQPCTSPAAVYTSDEAIRSGTLAEMKRYNIVKGFLSEAEENVYEWVKTAPDRFIPSIAFGSDFPAIAQLREAYRSGRLKGMGEIETQYDGISPNDPRLDPYYALAQEFDVPVLIHTLGIGAPTRLRFRASLGRPLLLEDVVVRHPKLRIYVENAGYPFLDEIVALMTQYPQVHADLSTITWTIPRQAFHRYLAALLDAGLGKRLMFGSDQMEWPENIGRAIEGIESAAFLTNEQKRDIFYNNAVRFLRLDERIQAR